MMRDRKSSRTDRVDGPVCKKNDMLVLDITDMGNDGEGIGRTEGYTLFVKGALTGDRVRVKVMKTKKHFGYARLVEILTASPYRVEPFCPVAAKCGGCQLQHCSYERQLRYKEDKVRDCLKRIGGFENISAMPAEHMVHMEPILSMENPYYYRNKAQFPIGTDKTGNIVAGFYTARTHQIVPHTGCMIQHPCNPLILETVLKFMDRYHVTAYDENTHRGLVRHVLTRVGNATGEIMVCLVINGEHLPEGKRLVEMLLSLNFRSAEMVGTGTNPKSRLKITSICLNKNTEKTNAILGKEISILFGKGEIEDQIGNIRYRISPLSFYQVNPVQTEKLYATALAYADLKGGEIVWDLYCGIGTISLFLAQRAQKVCGVEIVPQAVMDARENARLNGMDNVEFFAGAAEEVVPRIYEESCGALRADVVTLDPPRKGCDEKLLETVIKMQPDRIVYVSCDPATLSRDLKYLRERGYELKKVRACDMFGFSAHVECVIKLQRR